MKPTLIKTALAGLFALAAGAASAGVTVTYIESDKFADLPFAPWERKQVLEELSTYFTKLGEKLPAGQDLTIEVTDIDLAGRDVQDAVQTSVNPKVIDCPDAASGKSTLSAVAKNGVELKIRARVTVRTNLQQLIGGATEETIIARVGEGIITSIGSAESHFDVMEHPDKISKAVLARGLDAQTAFQIVSIDIADIEVGENIGARLQADQAEADTRVARAKAEERRSVAIAREQEMKASTAENRARLLQAEALVPKSIGDAFRAGRVAGPGGAA